MTFNSFHLVRNRRFKLLLLMGAGLSSWFAFDVANQAVLGGFKRGELEADLKSDFSRIRILCVKNTRTLWFVRDNGEEVVESMVDLDRPHDLLVDYTRFMFFSYLFRPNQQKVLIVGLGAAPWFTSSRISTRNEDRRRRDRSHGREGRG